MQMTAYLAGIFTIAGVVSLVLCVAADTRKGRIIAAAVGGLSLVLGALLIVSLVYYRPATCRALGGFWTPRGHCSSEFGGNGDNG